MDGSGEIVQRTEDLAKPEIYPVEAYISEDYARAERAKLWRKVWLQAGREQDLPDVGSYITYDILDDSVLIVRTAPDVLKAYANVCTHRGRRLVDTPEGQRNAHGRQLKFVCGFHAWAFDIEGHCTYVLEREDWQGKLTDERSRLGAIRVDTWGGWVWICLDPTAPALRDYLEPAVGMLEPFELQDMRIKWRKWGVFDCNWKVALEAFNETYHVPGTHPEFTRFGEFKGWAKAQGLHSNIGYDAPKGMENQKAKLRIGAGADPRVSTAEMQLFTQKTVNAVTTNTLVNAAVRLVDELPEGTPADKVLEHWLVSARRDDEARGVVWPTVDPEHVGKSGTAWQIFPNFQIGHAVNMALCYSARPYDYDPDKCYFEVMALELYPQGEEPETEWVRCEGTVEDFGPVLTQDFSNMAMVQQGMKNADFRGIIANPKAEQATVNLHRNLAKYMGTGAPRPLD